MDSNHTGYIVPPGASILSVPQNGEWTDIRFIFGGNPQKLRVSQINADCSRVQVSFDGGDGLGATPHEATVWFAKNPLAGANVSTYSVLVNSVASGDEQLQVTLLGTRNESPLDPPCGL
jgi:hypothetical protein